MGAQKIYEEHITLCWASALLTKSLLHPIDTLKTRIQTTGVQSTSEFLAHWKGQWGPYGLFRGLGTKLLLYTPYQLMYLAFFVSVNNALNTNDALFPTIMSEPQRLVLTAVLATSVAELASSPIRIFMEVTKSRLQVGMSGLLSAQVAEVRANRPIAETRFAGLMRDSKALWRHYLSQPHVLHRAFTRYFTVQILLHDLPFSCIQWSTYRLANYYRSGKERQEEHSQRVSQTTHSVRTGILSGIITAVITQPSDVLRCCVFTKSGGGNRSAKGETIRDVAKALWAHGGVRRMYRGLGIRTVWISSNSVLFFTALDYLKGRQRVS